MNRLPKKFEEEVLKKHEIEYGHEYYKEDWNHAPSRYVKVSKYEIAAIGLEAMGLTISLEETTWNIYEGIPVMADKDFCECIFKAINCIYSYKGDI